VVGRIFTLIPFKIIDTLDKARIIITEQIESKKLELFYDIDSRLIDLTLIGDPLRISQILLNYLSNAVKFTEQGHITLRAKLADEQGDIVMLKIEVQDTGSVLVRINNPNCSSLLCRLRPPLHVNMAVPVWV
jgi:signal transduction histidine kinase